MRPVSEKPVLIYDGCCSFCRIWIEYWKTLTGDAVEYAASEEQSPKSVQLVEPDGRVLTGAQAVFESLRNSPGPHLLAWCYQHVPLFAPVSEAAYRTIAAHRNAGYWITRALWGSKLEPARFERIEWLFVRLLAIIYMIAFVSFGAQTIGLIGSNGILPLSRYLAAARQMFGGRALELLPTVFWFNSSDAALKAVSISGAAVAILLVFGIAQRLCLAALFILYLSLTTAGQDFMSFQWDMLLLESGFLAIFLGSSKIVVWLFRLLMFRLMLLSGAVKLLSRDPAWRSLDALRFHYWTQPLPTPFAWYANQLPTAFQRISTAGVFVIELGTPFLIFLPRRARMLGVALMVLLQLLILLTGNYTFFNYLTIALCLFLLDDQALPRWIQPPPSHLRTPRSVAIPLALVIGGLGFLQIASTLSKASVPGDSLLRLLGPYGLVNSYGLFASMTISRPEIIVQGSNDGLNWQDYKFKSKPGDLRRAPPWVAPYQPRLDWQMWFAALSDWRGNPWFVNFMARLLQGSKPVLNLLETNPFPAAPPKYVRALVYEYGFTDFKEKHNTGDWWKREPRGTYLPAISFDSFAPRP